MAVSTARDLAMGAFVAAPNRCCLIGDFQPMVATAATLRSVGDGRCGDYRGRLRRRT